MFWAFRILAEQSKKIATRLIVAIIFFLGMQVTSLIAVIFCLIGYISVIYYAFKKLDIKKGLFTILIPFYPISIILKMEESNFKKFAAIFYIGGFLVFVLVNILQIIMTPQF